MVNTIIMILLSYVIGSFPTSIVTGKILKRIDIRQYGSGNAGATNVFRVLGWKAGLFVLVVDMAKGLVATIWIYQIANSAFGWPDINFKIIAGLAAVAGHIWTVFAGFKGGKGVGTGAGMILGIAPIPVLVGVVVFVVVVAVSRYVSLGSILASISVPVTLLLQKYHFHQDTSWQLLILGFIIPVLIIFTHRSNIQRLLQGTENRIQFKSASSRIQKG